ncbi:LytTR family DNA-binding domain-containing protein, partial [Zunongwangia sp. F363]
IHLPKLSGIDFLKILSNPPQVILTTAFSDYAIESYELDVVDYLLKPFSFERFLKAINKVHNPVGQKPEANPEERLIFIKSGYEHIKVDIDHLLYIKADMDYTELVSTNKTHLSNETLNYWEEQLSAGDFVRIHRSYLVNIKRITKFSSAQVQLSNDKILNVGRVYRENLKNKFKLL